MAMSKRDFEAMASLISAQIPELADVKDGRIFNEVGLRAVTRIAIGFMNQAYRTNSAFRGDKFLEWSGIGRWVEWSEGFTHKEARWVKDFRPDPEAWKVVDLPCLG